MTGNGPKFKCVVCDTQCSLEYYEKEANADEVKALLSLWKICPAHEKQITESLNTRQGINSGSEV